MTALPPTPTKTRSRACLRRLAARQAMPLVLIGLSFWLLRDRLAEIDFAGIATAVRAISPVQWLLAGLATLVSFWAVGRYDAVVHRLLNTGVPRDAAHRSGITAIATAQTTGFGLLIGALARWRMLPELTLWQSARVTLAVTTSFMAGLAIVGAVMIVSLGTESPVSSGLAVAVLLTALGFAALSMWRPRVLLHLALPPLRAQVALVALVALDTAAAAAALYVLLPAGDLPSLAYLYTVFLLALAAGLIGATPGGVGPFEFVCLALLPAIPEASLLAAITGFRLVYFGLPGALAACILITGKISQPVARGSRPARHDMAPRLMPLDTRQGLGGAMDAMLFQAKRAEAQLLRQGEFDLLCDGDAPLALAAASSQSLIVLGDPLPRHQPAADLHRLAQAAAGQRFLTPCLYKCGARAALAARNAGWRVLAVSREAWVAPHRFDLDVPQRRQLRRQLRKAETAGLRTVEAGPRLPLDEMRALAVDWANRRGGARGFSMGRFDEAIIGRQRVILCYDAQRRLVGFLSLHEARSEWTLDLMCHCKHAPPGTMQLLVMSAIQTARRRRCPRLSLAAAPALAAESPWIPARVGRWMDQRTGAPGLIRFKTAFAPHWEPLYMAAPSLLGLVLASCDLIDRITRPRKSRTGRIRLHDAPKRHGPGHQGHDPQMLLSESS